MTPTLNILSGTKEVDNIYCCWRIEIHNTRPSVDRYGKDQQLYTVDRHHTGSTAAAAASEIYEWDNVPITSHRLRKQNAAVNCTKGTERESVCVDQVTVEDFNVFVSRVGVLWHILLTRAKSRNTFIYIYTHTLTSI